jgi:hypothetical protein
MPFPSLFFLNYFFNSIRSIIKFTSPWQLFVKSRGAFSYFKCNKQKIECGLFFVCLCVFCFYIFCLFVCFCFVFCFFILFYLFIIIIIILVGYGIYFIRKTAWYSRIYIRKINQCLIRKIITTHIIIIFYLIYWLFNCIMSWTWMYCRQCNASYVIQSSIMKI